VREEILQRIHASHIGVNSCIRRARESVFWPNMTRDISKRISSCTICAQLQAEQSKEPLLPHDIPERPWQKVACDLFEFNHVDYLITVDYYSNFFEVDRLADKRAAEVIRHLKNHFARHGLPDVVMSDNGPPFQSAEFKAFAVAWEFNHITSSPRYSQSNGKIEKSVKTVKNLMKKSVEAHSDPYLALLDWRNTPSEGYNESPSQRLFSRRTRTKFPVSIKLLRVPGANRNKRSQRRAKSKQQHYYNRGAYRKPELAVSQSVRAKINESSGWVKAEVIDKLPFRSYTIETENGGTYRRNRRHLRLSNEAPIVRSELEPETTTEAATDIQQPEENSPREHQTEPNIAHPQTRSGRTVKRPAWMKDFHIQ
jgi:transposase InsO family protein